MKFPFPKNYGILQWPAKKCAWNQTTDGVYTLMGGKSSISGNRSAATEWTSAENYCTLGEDWKKNAVFIAGRRK